MTTTIDREQLHARLDEFLTRAAAGERILVRCPAGQLVALGPAVDASDDPAAARRPRHRATRTVEEVLVEDRGA